MRAPPRSGWSVSTATWENVEGLSNYNMVLVTLRMFCHLWHYKVIRRPKVDGVTDYWDRNGVGGYRPSLKVR